MQLVYLDGAVTARGGLADRGGGRDGDACQRLLLVLDLEQLMPDLFDVGGDDDEVPEREPDVGGDDDEVSEREPDEDVAFAEPTVSHDGSVPGLKGRLDGVLRVVEVEQVEGLLPTMRLTVFLLPEATWWPAWRRAARPPSSLKIARWRAQHA